MAKAPQPLKVLVVDDGDRYVELFHALLRDYEYATRCELAGPCWECPHRAGCTLTSRVALLGRGSVTETELRLLRSRSPVEPKAASKLPA